MNFNSINIRDLSDFKIIRYLARGKIQYKYVALYIPTKKFVVIDEKVELPGSNKVQDEYAKLLYDLGPQESVIQYLGFAHLDGRTYLVTKLYELGSLDTLLCRYRRNKLSFSEQSVVMLFKQLVRAVINLLNMKVYPHLNPQTVFLEEKVQPCYPDIDLVDGEGLSRRARVNLRLSAVELLSNISADMPRIDVDAAQALGFERLLETARPRGDRTLAAVMSDQLRAYQKDVFDPDYEPQSVSFISKRRQKQASKDRKRLVKRYQDEQMPTFLNAQNIDKQLYAGFAAEPFAVHKAPKTGEQLVIEELRQLFGMMVRLNDGALAPHRYGEELGAFSQILRGRGCRLETLFNILQEMGQRYAGNYVQSYQDALNARLRPASPTRSSSHEVCAFVRQAKKDFRVEDIEISVEPKSDSTWQDSVALTGAVRNYCRPQTVGYRRSASPGYLRSVISESINVRPGDAFGQGTQAQIAEIVSQQTRHANGIANQQEQQRLRLLRRMQMDHDAELARPKREVDPYYAQFSPPRRVCVPRPQAATGDGRSPCGVPLFRPLFTVY